VSAGDRDKERSGTVAVVQWWGRIAIIGALAITACANEPSNGIDVPTTAESTSSNGGVVTSSVAGEPADAASVPDSSTKPDVLVEGATGDGVLALQRELVDRGHPVDVDGIFGPGTTAAVREVQELLLLDPDGLVGPKTIAVLGLGTAGAAAPGVTATELADAIVAYLDDTSTSVPADVVAAIGEYQVFEIPGGQWTVTAPAPGVGGRTIVGFAYAGEGGVYVYMDLCIRAQTATLPAAFCGLWSVSGH
jgi:hypothetical protein